MRNLTYEKKETLSGRIGGGVYFLATAVLSDVDNLKEISKNDDHLSPCICGKNRLMKKY